MQMAIMLQAMDVDINNGIMIMETVKMIVPDFKGVHAGQGPENRINIFPPGWFFV